MRLPTLAGCTSIALCAASIAQGGGPSGYRPVAGWPSGGAQAPGYGSAAVSGVTTDRQGRVAVFQRAEPPVLLFDREGRYLSSWGKGEFTQPHGARFDPNGNLWLTDSADHRVLKFSPEGRLLATFGEKGVAGEDDRHFNRPADVAFAPNGDVYVADGYGNSRVVRLSAAGRRLGAWGQKGVGPGEFNLPHSIAVDASGRVIVADRENRRIQLFTAEGRFLSQWRHVGSPYGLHVFRTGGQERLAVSDGVANQVAVYDLQGKELSRWGGAGTELGRFDLAHLLTVDDRGALYVAEVRGKRVQKFTPDAR